MSDPGIASPALLLHRFSNRMAKFTVEISRFVINGVAPGCRKKNCQAFSVPPALSFNRANLTQSQNASVPFVRNHTEIMESLTMSGLWPPEKQAKREKVRHLWDSKKNDENRFRLFGGSSSSTNTASSSIDWGPGGAIGIGCGVGIGVALTGGAGIGATPWSALRVVFGVGAGCGLGVGYGYGYGLGLRWDKPPEQQPPKRLVIEL